MNEINRDYSVDSIIGNSHLQTDRTTANPTEHCTGSVSEAADVPAQKIITKISSNHDEFQPANIPTSETSRTMNVRLLQSNMWHAFAAVGTEMIITKAGRRLFPTIDVDVFGLDPKCYYSFKVDIVAADTKRYKYVSNTGWVGLSTEHKACRLSNQIVFGECEHPNSPNTGKFWMNCNSITFKKLKLSNSKEHYKKSDCIVLTSMRKYQPRIIVTKWDRDRTTPVDTQIVIFPETKFYAVTCYQNGQITNLKIRFNPFAKAFRDSKRSQLGATHDCVAYGYPRNAYVNQPVQRYAQYPLYGCYPNYANQYQLPADCVTNNRAIKHDGPTTFGPNSAITTYSSQTMQKTSIQGCLGSLSTHSYNNSPGGTSFQSEGATSGIYPPPRSPFESFNHVPPPPLLYRDWTPSTFI